MFSRSEKIYSIVEQRGNWQHAGCFRYETWSQLSNFVFFKEIQTINTALWLFNVSWQITVLSQFKRSSFHVHLKHEINIRTYFISAAVRCQYTIFFKFKSTEMNLLSCLICLPHKMADSALWLVRSPVNQALCERSIVSVSQPCHYINPAFIKHSNHNIFKFFFVDWVFVLFCFLHFFPSI